MPRLIELIPDQPAIERLDGRRYRKVSPRTSHARVQSLLVAIVERCGQDIGMAGTEWDFRVGAIDGTDSLLVPDAAFVSFERLDAVEPEEREELPIAPDIAIEVRSPASDATFRANKVARFLACGSQLVLDVDPQARCIIAHAAGGVRSYAAADRFEHPAVPWLAFDVAEAFKGLDRLTTRNPE
jgi:Uma2 family endonuclease